MGAAWERHGMCELAFTMRDMMTTAAIYRLTPQQKSRRLPPSRGHTSV
jgi:hypothetical protein